MINKDGNCELCSLRETCEKQVLAMAVASDMEPQPLLPCEQ